MVVSIRQPCIVPVCRAAVLGCCGLPGPPGCCRSFTVPPPSSLTAGFCCSTPFVMLSPSAVIVVKTFVNWLVLSGRVPCGCNGRFSFQARKQLRYLASTVTVVFVAISALCVVGPPSASERSLDGRLAWYRSVPLLVVGETDRFPTVSPHPNFWRYPCAISRSTSP